VAAFSEVTVQVKDVNHPGHEITDVHTLEASESKDTALVAVRCSRSPALETGLCEDTWTLDIISMSCGGHAMDYRPTLQSLYAAQATSRNARLVQWPYRGASASVKRRMSKDKHSKLPALKASPADARAEIMDAERSEGLATSRSRTPSRDDTKLPPVSARNRPPDDVMAPGGYGPSSAGRSGSPPPGDPENMSLTPLPPVDSPKALSSAR